MFGNVSRLFSQVLQKNGESETLESEVAHSPRHASRIASCLGFSWAYDDHNTKETQFNNLNLKDTSAMVLEGLRDLTKLRSTACSKPTVETVSFDERIHRLDEYLKLLLNLVQKENRLLDAKAASSLCFEWTIPQSSSDHFLSLQGVQLEYIMVLLLYAAALRQQGDALVLRTCHSAEEESEDFAAAARLFQRVAGIYAHISQDLLTPEIASGSKMQQGLPLLVRSMEKAALGEAQAVFASRAESRRSPPKLIATLHLGASELFESAAAELKPNPSQVASQRYRMFLALSSELHQARARHWIAAWQSKESHPGNACRDLLDARKRLEDASVAAASEARWQRIFAEEQEYNAARMKDYDKEREYVSYEGIAAQRTTAPEGKVVVKPTTYVPQHLTVEIF